MNIMVVPMVAHMNVMVVLTVVYMNIMFASLVQSNPVPLSSGQKGNIPEDRKLQMTIVIEFYENLRHTK